MNDETRARKQAQLNANASVRFGEEDAVSAALTAIAWALLDIANAIRETAKPESGNKT